MGTHLLVLQLKTLSSCFTLIAIIKLKLIAFIHFINKTV